MMANGTYKCMIFLWKLVYCKYSVRFYELNQNGDWQIQLLRPYGNVLSINQLISAYGYIGTQLADSDGVTVQSGMTKYEYSGDSRNVIWAVTQTVP